MDTTRKSGRWVSSKLALSAVLVAALSACGKGDSGGDLVQQVRIKTYEQSGELFAELKAMLNTGAMMLAGLDIPIVDRKHPGVILGHFTVSNVFCGKPFCSGSELTVSLSLTKMLDADPAQALLPNGSPLPVGGLAGVPIVSVNAGDSGARIYLGISETVAMLGLALPFREFDQVGSNLPGFNIFLPIDSDEGTRGVAGIFTGSAPGQSGLALFLDFSDKLGSATSLAREGRMSTLAVREPARLSFEERIPDSRSVKKIFKRLNRLDRERTVLHLH
ncbi:MAG: hypothetical protein NDJ89_18325 [Oligoflexia bacterium]|nr:hypothetical protein [Oligoflexia bacterium]